MLLTHHSSPANLRSANRGSGAAQRQRVQQQRHGRRPCRIGGMPQRRASVATAAAAKISSPPADWIAANMGAGDVVRERFVGGSGWSSASILTAASGREFFVKTGGGRGAAEMFRGEALGLKATGDTRTLRVPAVHHTGELPGGRGAFIVMEALSIGGGVDQAALGRRLAAMHSAPPSDPQAAAGAFGFAVDNTIGGTPQVNAWSNDWVAFYRERRLQYQLDRLGDARLKAAAKPVLDNLSFWFRDADTHPITPSVLHGDLWSGNIGAADGEPVVFDPATYYGHAEAEWGMSWCAGFTQAFWDGYFSARPRAPLFEARRPLYELYHILNHANLFGGGYVGQASTLISRLTAALEKGE